MSQPAENRRGSGKRPALASAVFLVLLLSTCGITEQESSSPETHGLQGFNETITTGAAPGYINDQACAACHIEVYNSYQQMGMAKSFFRPAAEKAIEDFDKSFYHPASQRHYQMEFRDGTYFFRRYQLDANQQSINELDLKVEWVLGSGHNARTYLYREPNGEMYQLPLAWYTQTESWGMAPGFDSARHLGVQRTVRRECMFCHNAYPDVPEATDQYARPHRFPESLPEGIGCQRCHGPGAAHVREAQSADVTLQRLHATIVNPSRLDAGLRDDVCDQCHLQPSVALFGVRAFGRSDYSYRPGQPLNEYLVQTDIVEHDKPKSERFEINHHPYRLRQSRCFQESSGAMNCLTCHDPHRKVPEQERAAHYRTACLGCHSEQSLSTTHAKTVPDVAASDCTSCHMQKRRTQDVVELLATDHLIRRRPGGRELVARIDEADPDIDDVVLIEPDAIPTADSPDAYRAAGALRATGGAHQAAADKLQQILLSHSTHTEPYADVTRSQLMLRDYKGAARSAAELLERDPDNAVAKTWAGTAAIGLGDMERAEEILSETIKSHPDHAEAHYNLALVLISGDRHEEARERLLEAVALRSGFARAWYYLGRVHNRLEQSTNAIDAYKRALAIDPTHTRSYLELGEVLAAQGKHSEALRFYEHGARVALQPAPIKAALTKLSSD